MYEALVARVRYHIQKANFMGLKEAESTLLLKESADAIEDLIAALNASNEAIVKNKPRWIPVTDKEHIPNTDHGVVGYFGGGAFNQLKWYDFVTTLSDGTIVGESTERDVINEHCIAVYKLPEPPKEE